jgi:secondary thiamine-phosphate synthase enzyme
MVYEFELKTCQEGFINITGRVQEAVQQSGIKSGSCIVFSPHTTAGMTINENADPDVTKDMLFALKQTYPNRPEFRHFEGNTAAHLKASFVGSSVTVIIDNAALLLGSWQGIYFCEFDGPRNRKFYVQVM